MQQISRGFRNVRTRLSRVCLSLRLLFCTQALQGAFTDVLEGTVKRDSFLFKWLDYLSFALR